MHPYLLLGLIMLTVYTLQTLLGLKQIKHFNESYASLRKQGRVAIGKKPGKIRAGTITMFALDNKGVILDALVMQGVTVRAKFKQKSEYMGENILNLNKNHILVSKENKLLRQSILEAKDIYVKVTQGNYVEETNVSPFMLLKNQVSFQSQKLKKSLIKK